MNPQYFSSLSPVSPLEIRGRKMRASRTIRGAALAWVAVMSLRAGAARAEDSEEEGLLRQGVEARRALNDAAALDFFRKAYALRHSPRAAAQMGLAEIALGRWVDAEGHLEEGMAATADPWVAKHGATFRESLERVRQHVGLLEILGGPPGAEIVIEGGGVGTLPLAKPLRVRSGDCRFVVKAVGYEPVSRDVEVRAGDLTRETVNLSKKVTSLQTDVAQSTGAAVTGTGARETAGTPETTVTANGARKSEESAVSSRSEAVGGHLPTVGIVLGAAGIGTLATGVFFGIKARSAGEEASKAPRFDPGSDSAGHRDQVLQYVGYGVGGALLVAGISTFVVGRNQNHEPKQPQVAIVPAAGGGVALFAGQF